MSKKKSKSVSTNLIYGLLLILFGILFIVGGAGTAQNLTAIIVTVIGALMLVYGIYGAVKGDVLGGVIEAVLGILMIVFAWTISYVAFVVIGVIFLVTGISGLVKHRGSVISNVIDLALGILAVLMACGVGFAWDFVNIFFYILGAVMIIDGVLYLIPSKK